MRKILSLVAASLCVAACIYPYDPELDEAPEGVLAVDGNITVGDVSVVRLSMLHSLRATDLSAALRDLSDSRVWVEDDAGEKYMGRLEMPTMGYGSLTSSDFSSFYGVLTFVVPTEDAPEDRRYRLCIEALGGTFTSDWSEIPAAPVIDKVDFLADDKTVTVAVDVDGGAGGTGYMLLSFDEAWEFHADYELIYSFNPNSLQITEEYVVNYERYWCWKTNDDGRSYPVDYSAMSVDGVRSYPLQSFARTDSRNHRRYCINVKAKTLTAASYRFLKNLEDNTAGGDNLFTPNPGDLPGNLHCENDPDRTVLGYVVVSRTASKLAYLDSRYLRGKGRNYSELLFLLAKDYIDYYNMGYYPLVENPHEDYDPSMEGPYGWGPQRCYDCIAAGGTKTVPSYWK